MNVQVTREVDITSILDSEVIAEKLQGNDVQQTLQGVDGFGYADGASSSGDTIIAFVAKHDGLGLARGDLGKGGLDLGVQRVLGHDDDDGHVLVNQSERTVL